MESPMGSFLCPPGYVGPRGVRALARETSVLTEAARYLSHTATGRLRGRGSADVPTALEPDQSPVVLVPGFMAGDASLALMARELRRVGYRTYRSRMHANVGCTQEAGAALERRIESVVQKGGRRVSIIGHSLGGLIGRAIASRRPDLVEGLVTLGSPILAPGASHAALQWDVALLVRLRRLGVGAVMGEDCTSGECAQRSWEQSRAPLAPGVDFTAIFSKRDGIVDWRSCLDPGARPVEVTSSHVGMPVDPGVIRAVAHVLHDSSRARLSGPANQDRAPGASAG